MANYEYKTVPLPTLTIGRLRRGQTRADQAAETLETLLHREAVDGWDFMRTETLTLPAASTMFGRAQAEETVTILIFRKVVDAVWRNAETGQHRAPSANTGDDLLLPDPPIRPPQGI